MYAIKGGWVGQTFALAQCNESGGRKARIRRSKEERKAMVESFIKTYQSSNDGKFPSLNLTHKEVGGSFYTVREIVRDVIQENRVLGPAKFSSEKQNFDGSTSEFAVESATMESHDYLFQLEIENPAFLDQEATATTELNMNVNEQYAKYEVVNVGDVGSNATEESDKEVVYVESLSVESVEDNGEPEFIDASKEYRGNTGIKLNFEGNEQLLDKHGDLDVEQVVNGSPAEEFDDVMATESSFSESFRVENGAALGVSTGRQENATFELKFSDNEQMNKLAGWDLGKYVNGSQVKESDKLDCVEPSPIEKHVVDRSSGLVEAYTTKLFTPTEDIVVETFPLRSVTKEINNFDTVLNDSRGLNGELEKTCGNSGNNGAALEKMDTSVNASEPVILKAVNDPASSSSNGVPVIAHETIENPATNLLEVEDFSRSGETADIDPQDYNKPAVESHNKSTSSKKIQEITGAKARDDQTTVCPNNFHGAKTGNSSSSMEATADKRVMVGGRANDIHKENEALKGNKATLDRMNLESWEGASNKSSEHERNPLLVFIKSLVSAFMKFMSE